MEQEIEEDIKGLDDYLAILARHKGKMILVFLLGLVLSVVIALVLPAVYQSKATILIEQQSIPTDLVRSTVTSYAGQRIQIISKRVMSTAKLQSIVDKFGLYKDALKEDSIYAVLDEMRDEINLDMVSADVIDPRTGSAKQATIAFNLSFNNRSPRVAQQVTNELVSLYLNENVKRRTEVAAETSGFLAVEAKKLGERIRMLETKLAEFKKTHADTLPELKQLNMRFMDRAEQEIEDLNRRIGSMNERQIYLQSELVQLNADTMAGSNGVSSAAIRLKTLRAEYPGQMARYSENHPDLVKMRREIEILQQEVEGSVDKNELADQLESKRIELAAMKERYSEDHPDVKKLQYTISNLKQELEKPSNPSVSNSSNDNRSNNPAYIQLTTQLEATKREIRSLQQAIKLQKSKMSIYENRLTEAPQVEQEYKELTRNYENALNKYREITAKQMEADISQTMEETRKGERFSLIEPPLLPEEPLKPNRLAVLLIGIVLSVVCAVGMVALLEVMDQSIRGAKALAAVQGASPLIVIPFIETDADKQRQQVHRHRLYVAVGVAIVVGIVSIHFFLSPLDVLWIVAQRRLGLV